VGLMIEAAAGCNENPCRAARNKLDALDALVPVIGIPAGGTF